VKLPPVDPNDAANEDVQDEGFPSTEPRIKGTGNPCRMGAMSIESRADLAGMQRIGSTVAFILQEMCAAVRVGMSTAELDQVGAAAMKRHGARSAPQMTYGFPGFTCISVNEEIVHGIPGPRRLNGGDVVKIDVTAEQDGYVADAARTVILKPRSHMASRLHSSAKAALHVAMSVARAGARVSVIGRAVHEQAKRDGFAVIRELSGHGVGRAIHEDPQVPNYEDRFSRDMLTEGLVIAVEPMFASDPARAVQMADGWTIRTNNGSLAVHEENTIIIRRDAPPLVVTAA
jgi:methionyl aminopeptidase